jgi:hypothetical protein
VIRPALLQTLAVVSWIVTLIGAFTGFDGDLRHYSDLDERVWLCMLGVSCVTTLAAVVAWMASRQAELATEAARVYVAATKAAVTRPNGAAQPSGPLAKLATGPLAKLLPLPHGRHAHQEQ